jgi:hypothetical protein
MRNKLHIYVSHLEHFWPIKCSINIIFTIAPIYNIHIIIYNIMLIVEFSFFFLLDKYFTSAEGCATNKSLVSKHTKQEVHFGFNP